MKLFDRDLFQTKQTMNRLERIVLLIFIMSMTSIIGVGVWFVWNHYYSPIILCSAL